MPQQSLLAVDGGHRDRRHESAVRHEAAREEKAGPAAMNGGHRERRNEVAVTPRPPDHHDNRHPSSTRTEMKKRKRQKNGRWALEQQSGSLSSVHVFPPFKSD